eukprot:9112743-Pyramimonas_sp.AAC.1
MQCRIGGRMLLLRLCVVPGWTPLLVSKPMLKALGAVLDMERDEIRLTSNNVAVLLKVAASGHYQLNLCEMNGESKNIQTAEVDAMATSEATELEEFVAAATAGFR